MYSREKVFTKQNDILGYKCSYEIELDRFYYAYLINIIEATSEVTVTNRNSKTFSLPVMPNSIIFDPKGNAPLKEMNPCGGVGLSIWVFLKSEMTNEALYWVLCIA